MSQQIKINGSRTEKRLKHREKTMSIGDQMEAVLDAFRHLKMQGYDVGSKMDSIISEDDKIRSKYR